MGKAHFRLVVKLKLEAEEQIIIIDFLFRKIKCLLVLKIFAFDLDLKE